MSNDYYSLDYCFWSNNKDERFLEISIIDDEGGRKFTQGSVQIPLKELFDELETYRKIK